MRPRRIGLRVACAVAIGLAGSAAAGPLTDWLASAAPDALPGAEATLQAHIDALPKTDIARRDAVARVTRAWADAAPRTPRRQSATRVLCRIAPFAPPDRATGAALGAYFESLWADFRVNPTEQTLDEARFADCAAQNMPTGYFGLARDLPRLIPFGDCAAAEAPPHDLLRRLDRRLAEVIAAAPQASYYRVRAQYYGALTRVALALHDLRTQRVAFAAGRDAIAATGRDLLDAAADDDFLDGRNAWRFHNDFRAIGAIFALTAIPRPQAGPAPRAVLEALAEAPPLLDDPALRAVVEPWLMTEIEQTQPDYIDPVRVDRLFPGLLNHAPDDCARNRRQSIETRDLAAAALQCHAEVAPIDRWSRLRAYDDCLTEVQSRVWWVQLGAFRSAEAAEAERAELEALLGTGDTPELRVIPPDAASAYYRIRTLPELTRSEAGDIEALVTRSNKQILIGRQRLY